MNAHDTYTTHVRVHTHAHTCTGLPAGVGWVEKDTKANTGMENAHTVWGGGYLRGEVLATEGSSLGTLGEFHGRHHVPGEIGVPSLGSKSCK